MVVFSSTTWTIIFALFLLAFTSGSPQSHHTTYPDISACVNEPLVYSCENTAPIKDTCCSPTPGGLVLATQFWDTWTGLENKGQLLPQGSWTLHGLWPDNCDGSFEQYCDPFRQYDAAPSPAILPNGTVIIPYKGPDVSTFIDDFGREGLLEYMNTYWISQGSPNTNLWAHEYSKHGTCTSTFDTTCYGPDYKKHQELVDYFEAAIRAFRIFPTYDMLAASGITPSNKTTYTLKQIQNALRAQAGGIPYLGCSQNGTVLSEVWYFNHVQGTEQFGHFKTLDSVTPSTCSNSTAIHYYERTKSSEHDASNIF